MLTLKQWGVYFEIVWLSYLWGEDICNPKHLKISQTLLDSQTLRGLLLVERSSRVPFLEAYWKERSNLEFEEKESYWVNIELH